MALTLCVPPHRMCGAGGPQTATPNLPCYFHLPESVSPVRLGSQAGRLPVSLARERTILGIFMMEQFFLVNKWKAVNQGRSSPSFWFTFLHVEVSQRQYCPLENVPGLPTFNAHPIISLRINIYSKWGGCPFPTPCLGFLENKSPWCSLG